MTTVVNGLDWKGATGNGTLLDLIREGREKGEQGSESPSRERWKIKQSTFINYECVCVAHTAGCEGWIRRWRRRHKLITAWRVVEFPIRMRGRL
jgi:hypothetical protein